MHTIYIFGLGPSHLGEMPKKVYETISQQEKVYLRTMDHPAAQELKAEGLNIESFDSKYEEFDEDFEQVYPAIVDELLHLAKTGDVYYGVPGHPAVAETTVQLLLEAHEHTKIIGGRSFIDDLFAAVKIDPINGFQLVDSFDLDPDELFPGHQLIVMQVFHSMIASNVKLALMEIYPDEHPIAIIDAAGSPEEHVEWMPLYELDYFEGVHNLRSIYVPPLERDEAVHSFATLQSYIDEIFGENGDVWAKELTGEKLLDHFQEELDELKEAYANEDLENVVEELGDLFMQLLYQTAVGEKEGIFSLEEVLEGINKKLRRRHPHVFDGVKAETPEEVDAIWQKIKEQERNGEF
ncbi:MAG TPA: MazG nucleotide pyrophosphohydrolase domain-containing protein [Atopostipes sp.]|nr:MazG nucleotide pyrophosphohydrolase domain-containing protein [Atopostipes sp.]